MGIQSLIIPPCFVLGNLLKLGCLCTVRLLFNWPASLTFITQLMIHDVHNLRLIDVIIGN